MTEMLVVKVERRRGLIAFASLLLACSSGSLNGDASAGGNGGGAGGHGGSGMCFSGPNGCGSGSGARGGSGGIGGTGGTGALGGMSGAGGGGDFPCRVFANMPADAAVQTCRTGETYCFQQIIGGTSGTDNVSSCRPFQTTPQCPTVGSSCACTVAGGRGPCDCQTSVGQTGVEITVRCQSI